MTLDQFDLDTLRAAQASAGHAWASARASIWSATIGILGLVLNGGGLLFIYKQLKTSEAAANAATEATRIASLEQRPWLKVEPTGQGHIYFRVGPPRSVMIHLGVTIENIGQTPAVMMDYRFGIVLRGVHEPAEVLKELQNMPPAAESTVFPGDRVIIPMTTGKAHNLQDGDFVEVAVVCLVRYRSYASTQWHSTPLLLAVGPAPEPGFDDAADALQVQAQRREISTFSQAFGTFHPT